MASTPALSSEALRAYILHSLLYFPSKGKGILIPCLSIAPVYNLGAKGLRFYPIDLGLPVVHRNVHRKLMFVLHQAQGLSINCRSTSYSFTVQQLYVLMPFYTSLT
jgi:hypothetical protein